MDISYGIFQKTITVELIGKLDYNSSFELSESLDAEYKAGYDLAFDFEGLDYISSAGFRVLVSWQKKLFKTGNSLVIINANDNVKETFNITGFAEIFGMK